jgi:hypothetical protein
MQVSLLGKKREKASTPNFYKWLAAAKGAGEGIGEITGQ